MPHQSLYIASTEPQSGTLIISIGFMEMLKGKYTNVAFFRPIVPDIKEDETHIGFIREHFGLKIPYEDCIGFTESEVIRAFAEEREEILIESLIAKVDHLQKEYDFVLIDGYPRNRFASTFDFDINLRIAKNLGTVFCPVLNAKDKSTEEISNEIQILSEMILAEGCKELAIFVNRCDISIAEKIQKGTFDFGKGKQQVYCLLESREINTPTLGQIVKVLDAKVILCEDEQLNHPVKSSKIAAMGMANYIKRIAEDHLIIVPSDRNDILLASHLSYAAKNHPNISGLILSGGIEVDPVIITLIKDFHLAPIPILSVESDSYNTAIAVEKIKPKITPADTHKITLIKALFDTHVNKEKLAQSFRESKNGVITPMMFEYRLFQAARADKKTIVLPESEDERILKAASILLQRDIVNLVLLGEREEIEHRSAQLRLDLSKAQIISPSKNNLLEKFTEQFYELRKNKGLTLLSAQDAMSHTNYFATMMLYNGMVDGLVSGASHTTADTIRPALQIIKTKPGIPIVSSIFFMLLDTKVLVYGDCAVNLDPTAEQLAHIAISSAETAAQFGIEPRVALLSYSTGSSGSGPDVEKVREAARITQKMRPDLLIEGPMQYDAAIDENVAKKKLPDSKVAGRATVFVFPDLNTGNNTYKAVQRSTGAIAIGPVLQGLKLPVNDLSRGCLVDDIVNTVAITAIQASLIIEKIGEEKSAATLLYAGQKTDHLFTVKNHHQAIETLFTLLKKFHIIAEVSELNAVGHRVVHGGPHFSKPTLVTAEVIEQIRSLIPLAPLHNPSNLEGIEIIANTYPALKQVAVFDTAFHQTMPEYTARYPLPYAFYEEAHIRRYGFHGTSHAYVAQKAAIMLGRPLEALNLITLHLGNGASATAIQSGKSIDTSMGLTPLEGLMMGTRSGDIDPAIISYLVRTQKMDVESIDRILNRESGLKGICNSNDMRDIIENADKGDKKSRLALEMYVYRIKKYIGAYTASLGYVDALVFTGGIGEHASRIRQMVCNGLECTFGIVIDIEKNLAVKSKNTAVQTAESKTAILVISTNEELEIARQTEAVIRSS